MNSRNSYQERFIEAYGDYKTRFRKKPQLALVPDFSRPGLREMGILGEGLLEDVHFEDLSVSAMYLESAPEKVRERAMHLVGDFTIPVIFCSRIFTSPYSRMVAYNLAADSSDPVSDRFKRTD